MRKKSKYAHHISAAYGDKHSAIQIVRGKRPWTFDARPARCSRRPGHPRSAMQAAQQQELEAMTDMFNKCALALSALQRVSSSLSRQPRVAAG